MLDRFFRLTIYPVWGFRFHIWNVEDLLHERGVDVCHEAVRYRWRRLASQFISQIKKRRAGGLRAGNRSGVKIGDLMIGFICPTAAMSTMNLVDFCGSNLQHQC